jgi:zinc/manganese transport system substrate-binding protein
MHRNSIILAAAVVAIIVIATVAGAYVVYPRLFPSQATANQCTTTASPIQETLGQSSNIRLAATSSQIQIVAGENFWGSLVSQLGGTHVQVLSIVTDPNADPHEYESSAADARAFAHDNYTVINGAGYDDWAVRIMQANPNPSGKVLNVADLLGKKAGDNPHFWYSPTYVNMTVHQMYKDLTNIDASNAEYYHQQYVSLNASLSEYNAVVSNIKLKYAGTKVASTESIFEYLADATGLNLISPPSFMEAISEGNDPTPQDIATFQQQLQTRSVKVLVYNSQTATPITDNLKSLAAQKCIQTVAISETVQPPDAQFQTWMKGELIALQTALGK